jgi:methylglutaconyl-CoA hydratase
VRSAGGIRLERDGRGVVRLTLTRPEVRNAFDEATIRELTEAARAISDEDRAVVLQSEGPVFCAGADLDWMARMAEATEGENLADARAMAEMYATLDEVPVPIVVRVQGAAIGGGAGLVAVCDIAVASVEASFAFREVRVGIIPAVVSPFVVRRVGYPFASSAFLTGERFDARRAYEVGLVQRLVEPAQLDEAVEGVVREILAGSPEAVRAAKRLLREIEGGQPSEVRERTVQAIAAIRATADAREGFRAFKEKRRPRWEP